MFVLKSLTFFICAVIAFNDAKYVDTLTKCSVKDDECIAKLITSAMQYIIEKGDEDLGIPSADPYAFTDITVKILDIMELKATDGTLKGAKNCAVEYYKNDFENAHSELALVCTGLTLKTKYKVSGSSPLLKNLFDGESIRGEGNSKVKIEKLRFVFDYFFDVIKNKDGDMFFKCKFNQTLYTYEILGKVTFAADNIVLGDKDSTKLALAFMNENSKFLMTSFGKPFMDKAMDLVHFYLDKFFSKVPVRYYITDDLSKYVKS